MGQEWEHLFSKGDANLGPWTMLPHVVIHLSSSTHLNTSFRNENFEKGHAREWIRIADQEIDADIHQILGKRGYKSTCDFPSSVYWQQQVQKYPDAKVILILRNPEEWYDSFMRTIGT